MQLKVFSYHVYISIIGKYCTILKLGLLHPRPIAQSLKMDDLQHGKPTEIAVKRFSVDAPIYPFS